MRKLFERRINVSTRIGIRRGYQRIERFRQGIDGLRDPCPNSRSDFSQSYDTRGFILHHNKWFGYLLNHIIRVGLDAIAIG